MLVFGPTGEEDGPMWAVWFVASFLLPVAGAVVTYRLLHRRRAATPPRSSSSAPSDTHCRVRVGGIEFLILSLGYVAYGVGALVVAGSPLDRLLPAVFVSVLVVGFSVRTPWAVRVEPTRVVLSVGPLGLVRIALPRRRVFVTFHTRSDWGSKTRELRVGADEGWIALVDSMPVANARFGVRRDHSETLLAAFRRFDYRIEHEATAT